MSWLIQHHISMRGENVYYLCQGGPLLILNGYGSKTELIKIEASSSTTITMAAQKLGCEQLFPVVLPENILNSNSSYSCDDCDDKSKNQLDHL